MVPRSILKRWAMVTLLLTVPFLNHVLESLAQFVVPGLVAGLLADLVFGTAAWVVGGALILGGSLLVVSGFPGGLIWLSQTVSLSLLLIVAQRSRCTGPAIFLSGALLLALIFMITLGVAGGGSLFASYQEIVNVLKADLDQSLILYRENAAGQAMESIELWFAELKGVMVQFLPSLLGLAFTAVSLSNVLVARKVVLKRLGFRILEPDFREWKLPEHLIWAVIAAGGFILAGDEAIRTGGQNALVVLGGLYFLQGTSIIACFCARFKVPVFVRGLLFILISIQWYGLLTVAAIGLADIWFDFRSRISGTRQSPAP